MTKRNLQVKDAEPAIHKYTGLVTQDEFRLRYCFIKARIISGYTSEELSFLIGKSGFYISDYEKMNNAVKLTLEDLEILSLLLINLYPEVLLFDIDDFGISEKRIVRGKREEIYGHYHYSFKHHWTIEGKNSEIQLKEPIFRLEKTADALMYKEVSEAVQELIRVGFFLNKKRTAPEILMQLKPSENCSPFIRPRHLMSVIYDLVKQKILTIASKRNRVYYHQIEPKKHKNI